MKEVRDLTEYEANGTVYKVDNKCVLLDHNQVEKEIANIFPSLTLVTIKKALIHFIIWVLEPLYMQENVAIFLLFSSL